MKDLMKAWRVQEGQRAAHLDRKLELSKQIQQDRDERFKILQALKSRNKQKVDQKRAAFRPQGVRSPAAIRCAFDVIASEMNGPKSDWSSSAEWFMATLDVINSEENLCLALFEPKTDYFLDDMKVAMQKADEQHGLTLIEKRTPEEYADLMGTEPGTKFKDCFLFFMH